MRTVVLVIMAVLLLACAACVGIGYFKVVPLFRDLIEEGGEAVSASMAATLRRSVIAAIDADDVAAGTIVLREVDLRVSDSVAVETGEAGFETGTNGTRVYGLAIAVDEDAVSLLIGDEVIYSGVPEVVDGDVVLTGVEGSGSAFDWFISKERFADAFETGLNDALAIRDAEPVAVALRDGALVLTVAGAASTPTASPVSDPRPRAA